ncbi:prolipoprotein diacylglyceryl transferase [Arcanobacterium wilhelmae]|uniref:Phosphatidylglycerol--prolipoprotein diacylglyceryl transferase n=1 Tax=Arcanobacterium wilhelmae TaxID=1803177 RepID=A0ABT9N8E6_9ACTO|nr:prolipoprotein diacylglyceryl transferase [Arcanobacterium wilhelmae]MDP9799976.1 prolipoprotein diacylglyceryl transferase [Arcanobacterium wilhelmae]WFN91109.1 prolipoprotein diacylglyceryl transferase [Arcanobacterium wilhelmae]
MSIFASIPSPSQGVWYLGPLPIRAYALAILTGIIVAYWLSNRRYIRKGGGEEVTIDVVVWMVIVGILGARVYHLMTSPDAYFGAGGDPWKALRIWEGGLGIWGAVVAGAGAAYVALHRRNLRLAPFADAVAPGLVLAQAIGRWGNYFNQELFGRPTTLPWGLEIDAAHLPAGYAPGTLFHPTFLYESLWNLGVFALLLFAERRFRLRGGQVFVLYVIAYTAGRVWIEALRIDEAHFFLGLRLNVWTSIIVFVAACVAFALLTRHLRAHPELDDIVLDPSQDAPTAPGYVNISLNDGEGGTEDSDTASQIR